MKDYFVNTGHGVQFNPSQGTLNATTHTHLGIYEFSQVHMHWGRNDRQGSEHTVDASPYSLEVHFVHTKQGEQIEVPVTTMQ